MGSFVFFFFQAEDGIRDLVRSRGLGDVYKRQLYYREDRKGQILEEGINEGGAMCSWIAAGTAYALSLIHI